MNIQVIFNGYTIEHIDKGMKGYDKMVISYSDKGQAKTTNILSFASPAVFDAVKQFNAGDALEVELVKSGAYWNWASVKKAEGATAPVALAAPTNARGGTWETPEERAMKQVYIIKQSCLAQAVALIKGTGGDLPASVEDALGVAQEFVDWVLEDGAEKA